MKVTIEITEQEIKDLKLIRNYFGEHDKTQLEHLAYSELDKLLKKLQQADFITSVCPDCNGTGTFQKDQHSEILCVRCSATGQTVL